MTTFLLMLVTALPAAGDKNSPKPNTLTPQEIADGWLLLFDGETTFGWKVEGEAKVEQGVLIVGGKKAARMSLTTPFPAPAAVSLEGRWTAAQANAWPAFKARPIFDCQSYRIMPPPESMGQWATVSFTSEPLNLPRNRLPFAAKHSLKVQGGGISQSGWDNRETSTPGMRVEVPAGTVLQLRNVKLRPLGLKAVFNGKDLTGWKEIPGKKSKFTVTKEGWLSVKDGPGDLQTEAKWADFVLQLDCVSNGTHLNSGVFFRSLPGQFWSGYEAQIRNQWQGNDRNKPVDYGTGGLYGRQPARKVVSSDKEWFTMTVVAHGRHIAIWVNGYQTVDFTDDRKGARTDAGPVSIQGHDPTTDLSFRNIRVAELAKVAK
jgi:hypothetical protein